MPQTVVRLLVILRKDLLDDREHLTTRHRICRVSCEVLFVNQCSVWTWLRLVRVVRLEPAGIVSEVK